MTTPSPSQPLASEISSLQSKIASLQESVRLSTARDAIEDLQTKVTGLGQRVSSLRTQGYVYGKGFESQAENLKTQWQALFPGVQQQLSSQAAGLQASLRPVEAQLGQLNASRNNPAAARPLLVILQSSVGMLEDKVSAAEKTIDGMYDQFDNQVYEFVLQLDEIESMLSDLAEASFQLLPTEAGIAAVKAVWCKSGKEQKDDPEGVLFLTDQRLIFEQKQEIATKKVLFVTTEKQKLQAKLWELPVAQLDKAMTSKQGMLKNENHLEVHFVSGAPLEMAHLHIWQNCETWQALLNRARAKDFDQDRAVAIDQGAVERVKAAPSQCPSCGGNIKQVVLRGQDSIKCEYCGFLIRL